MDDSGLFQSLSQGLERIESDILALEDNPGDIQRLTGVLKALGLAGLDLGDDQAQGLLKDLTTGQIQPDGELVDALFALLEAVKRLLWQSAACSRDPFGQCGQLEDLPPPEEQTAGDEQAVADQPALQEAHAAQPEKPEAASNAQTQQQAQQKPPTPRSEQHYVKVSAGKLDDLMSGVQELVISHSMLGQQVQGAAAQAGLHEHQRCIETLRGQVLDMRRVSMRPTFTRMARLVREIAAATGKQAELQTVGDNVEADKSVIDELADPLIHLLRNAVDHGLEPPQRREELGKPPAGVIRLSAEDQGEHLVLRIEDDGRGLNREAILNKAQERGLLPPGQSPTDQDIYQLILAPGFSTAETVSAVSGRGVGMDVVARGIRDLGGELNIASAPGRGTIFTINAPSRRAALEGITQGLLLQVGDEHFVLRSGCVLEVFSPDQGSVHHVPGQGEVIAARQGNLPLHRLHRLLDIAPRHGDAEGGLAVVAETRNGRVALQVDDVLGERQVVVRTLKTMQHFLAEPVYSGIAFIGSMAAMILDLDVLVNSVNSNNKGYPLASAQENPER